MQRWFLILIVIGAAAWVVEHPGANRARVIFVSPDGDDSNPGTRSRPLRTIQHAADSVDPGDTVVVKDGIYTGAAGVCGSQPVVCVKKGGTASAPVTFRAEHAGGAKLDGLKNHSTHGFLFRGASYVTVDGFEIYGMGLPDLAETGSAHGIMIDVGHDVTLRRLNVHDIGRVCTSTQYGFTGVFVRVPRVTITGSTFHDIGRLVRQENGCPLNIAPRFDHAIYLSGEYSSERTPGAGDVLISNNIFYNINRGWDVHLYPGTLPRISIVNNTFAFPHPSEPGQIIIAAATSDLRIENNIFYRPKTAAVYYYKGEQTNLSVRNNLVYDAGLMTSAPAGPIVASNRVGDPLFVNARTSPYDFHLTAKSPAIGAGLRLAGVPIDFDGVPRTGAAFDAGAYQSTRR